MTWTKDDRELFAELFDNGATIEATEASIADELSFQHQTADWTLIDGDLEPGDDSGCLDVRLQVQSGTWAIRIGDSSYDQDHRGHWGASILCGNMTVDDINEEATNLIDQALESYAMNKD